MELSELKRWRVKMEWLDGKYYEVFFYAPNPDTALHYILDASADLAIKHNDHQIKILGIKEEPYEATEQS